MCMGGGLGARRAGVVYTAGEKHYPNLMLSLYSLIKHHNSTLPVEVRARVGGGAVTRDELDPRAPLRSCT